MAINLNQYLRWHSMAIRYFGWHSKAALISFWVEFRWLSMAINSNTMLRDPRVW